MQVDILKTTETLSSLIDKVEAGEEVILTKESAAFQIVPKQLSKKATSFPFGCIPGVKIKDNFDDPLPKDIAEAFGIVDDNNETST